MANKIEVIIELPPSTRIRKLIDYVETIKNDIDAISLPDAPLGIPVISTTVLATILVRETGVEVIPHIRVSDYNRISLLQTLRGLAAIGVRRVLFTRGDIVEGVTECYKSAEEALRDIPGKEDLGLEYGALISLRKPLDKIIQRLKEGFDFYYLLRVTSNDEKLAQVADIATSIGKKLYAYVIVVDSLRKEELPRALQGQPLVPVSTLKDLLVSTMSYVDGYVVSSPLSKKTLLQAVKKTRSIALKSFYHKVSI